MENFIEKNYYEILEVQSSATLQDINEAYVRTKNAYSGDSAALYSLMSSEECARILEQVEDAYSILGDADKRREYDIARGFNQNNTPEGFQEEILSEPSFKPTNNLDALDEASKEYQEEAKIRAQKEEFQYKSESTHKDQFLVSKSQAVNKFGLNFDRNEELEQEIENCTEFNGAFLQKIREYKQVSIERMAEMTKISKTYIKNIEADEHSKLPAPVFTRGFVYQYAKCLKLNPDLVATSYINYLKGLKNSVQ